jgi:hypothetical protein
MTGDLRGRPFLLALGNISEKIGATRKIKNVKIQGLGESRAPVTG